MVKIRKLEKVPKGREIHYVKVKDVVCVGMLLERDIKKIRICSVRVAGVESIKVGGR